MNKFKGLLFLLALSVPVVSFSASDSNPNMDKMLHDMELHWKQVIAENNPSKRQRMIKDHANMMMDIKGLNKGLSPEQRKATHHNNVLEMHHMMMETMVK